MLSAGVRGVRREILTHFLFRLDDKPPLPLWNSQPPNLLPSSSSLGFSSIFRPSRRSDEPPPPADADSCVSGRYGSVRCRCLVANLEVAPMVRQLLPPTWPRWTSEVCQS